ncbi:MAG: AbrB/MazE/SpoVT family DNA-binding domain-containing protein [Terracidiphilus sp.]|nr:AbrB/MazE/SpoVT family DNA-binding domain-containing protein [Terracidiphilus sp.]MDR3797505.1 AbrB/MazE/SpoVT family DNA-binding domain-containing protein [Terracidiphilus sp.]
MDTTYATVSTKGQLVIPASIREELGIEPGTRVAVRVDGGQLILNPQSIEAKLRRIKAMRGYTAGGPSGTDILLEDRRIERERELRNDGF